MNGVRHFLLAVQYFTRIPITGRLAHWVGYSPAMLRASAAHFPAVGWLVGAFSGAIFAALALALPANAFMPMVAAALSTVASVWLTGGFHEDGLADVADGLGGSVSRERALEIMKDSRIGAYGAMALALVLLSKVALLALLGAHSLQTGLAALLGAHVVSRFWPLVLVRTLVHVGDTAVSKSKPVADQISAGALVLALAWCLPALALLAHTQGLAFVASATIATGLACASMWRLFARRLQGFTGDCLGATQQVCEIAFYLAAALALSRV
jgi:adenosylcobinamide-GDP ribazoletransferase